MGQVEDGDCFAPGRRTLQPTTVIDSTRILEYLERRYLPNLQADIETMFFITPG